MTEKIFCHWYQQFRSYWKRYCSIIFTHSREIYWEWFKPPAKVIPYETTVILDVSTATEAVKNMDKIKKTEK